MSRYGKKRCSYCFGFGHNRRTCPDRPQEEKDARKQVVRDHHDRMKSLGYRKSTSNRKCSQCGETGHNRKTCPEYKHLDKLSKRLILRQQEAVRKLLNKQGITAGAMIVTDKKRRNKRCSSWSDECVQAVYIVTEIVWDRFELHDFYNPLHQVVNARRVGSGEIIAKFKGEDQVARIANEVTWAVGGVALAQATLEDYEERSESYTSYTDRWTQGLQTDATREHGLAIWERRWNGAGHIESTRLAEMSQSLQDTLSRKCVVTGGLKPTKKLSQKGRFMLTEDEKFSNMKVDGETKKPFSRNRVESAEKYTVWLEEQVK